MGFWYRLFNDIDVETEKIFKSKREYTWKDFLESSDFSAKAKLKAKRNFENALEKVVNEYKCPICEGEIDIHTYETGRYIFTDHSIYYCTSCDFRVDE